MKKILYPTLLAWMMLVSSGFASSMPKNSTPVVTASPAGVQEQTVLLRTFTEKIHSSMPLYSFQVYGFQKNSRYMISKISIVNLETGETVQDITVPPSETMDAENFGVYLEDMNFDGYKDVRIQSHTTPSPNVPYRYWTFHLAEKRYQPDTELEMVVSPKVDSQNQQIVSYTRSSAAMYYKTVYQYIDGHLQKTKETELLKDPRTQTDHITVTEWHGDSKEVIKYARPFPPAGSNSLDNLE